MILDKFPDPEEFYKKYWNKAPFIVRGGVAPEIFDGLLDPESLAGLAMEEDIKSRIVITAPEGKKWVCEHGPFDEDKFAELDGKQWSLLVQNVEQYYTDVSQLLKSFHFSPRWLMDDIMVSYSTAGGSVGPHIDSYHVFLVQGMGRRMWRVGNSPIQNAENIDGQDFKILKNSFDATEVEVSAGDVIYIPPNFAHEGTTTQDAMTFSVGFLGPKISEILSDYGRYVEEKDTLNQMYGGDNIDIRSGSFVIDSQAVSSIKSDLIEVINNDDFSTWLIQYFSTPTHDELDAIEPREDEISSENLIKELKNGGILSRAEHVKLSITKDKNGALKFAVYGEIIPTLTAHEKLIYWLNDYDQITLNDLENLGGVDALIELVTHLYNHNVLCKL